MTWARLRLSLGIKWLTVGMPRKSDAPGCDGDSGIKWLAQFVLAHGVCMGSQCDRAMGMGGWDVENVPVGSLVMVVDFRR